MPGHIAAVDAGDIAWTQGDQRTGVIPVVEMAPVVLHFIHRVERERHAPEHLSARQVAKVPCRQVSHK